MLSRKGISNRCKFLLQEEELLGLTKTISGEQCATSKLTSDLEEASAAMEALKGISPFVSMLSLYPLLPPPPSPLPPGQHQLECAQLTIRARELAQQLEAANKAKEELAVSHLATLDRAVEEHQAVVQGLVEREKMATGQLEKQSKKHEKDLLALEKKYVDWDKGQAINDSMVFGVQFLAHLQRPPEK